jgi:hypothetical protein
LGKTACPDAVWQGLVQHQKCEFGTTAMRMLCLDHSRNQSLTTQHLYSPSAAPGRIRVKYRTEIGRSVRFSVELRPPPSHHDATVCGSTVTVFHVISGGSYHVNIMHTMFRLGSLQTQILILQDALKRINCAKNVSIQLVLLLKKTYREDIGVYSFMVPVLRGLSLPVIVSPVHKARRTHLLSFEPPRCYANAAIGVHTPSFFGRPSEVQQRAWRELRSGLFDRCPARPQEPLEVQITFINRRDNRRIVNLDESVEVLRGVLLRAATRPFHIVVEDLERKDLCGQIAPFQQSRVVIAMHGSALAYALAARRGGMVVELMPSWWTFLRRDRSMFEPLVEASELRHRLMIVRGRRSNSSSQNPLTSNVALSRDEIEEIAHLIQVELSE